MARKPKGRTITKVIYVEVPFNEVWPGQYHEDECAWDDEDGCTRCSEELDEAYDWASKQVKTHNLVVLDWMLANKPMNFCGAPEGDLYWEIEVSLGRKRKND